MPPGDNVGAFDALLGQYREHYAPAGPTEVFLCDRLVGIAWRLARLERVEAGMLHREPSALAMFEPEPEPRAGTPAALAGAFAADACNGGAFAMLSHYEGRLTRLFELVLHELLWLQDRRQAAGAGNSNPA